MGRIYSMYCQDNSHFGLFWVLVFVVVGFCATKRKKCPQIELALEIKMLRNRILYNIIKKVHKQTPAVSNEAWYRHKIDVLRWWKLHVLIATSTCTYCHKYWEFWQKQHEVSREFLFLMSGNFVSDWFDIVRPDSASPHLLGSIFLCLKMK